MDKAGIDLGYNAVKVIGNNLKVVFPSAVGTPDKPRFKMVGTATTFTIRYQDKLYNIGDSALEQSRFLTRHEDRDWINSIEYMVLFHAALSSIKHSGTSELTVVTGLPLAYFVDDKETIRDKFTGVHHVYRDERDVLTVNVKCLVSPQAMGTLASVALNDEGKQANAEVLKGRVGIIDIGGHTTNILHAFRMGDIERQTDSIEMGGWNVARAMESVIERVCPGADYNDHEIADIIRKRSVKCAGKVIDLSSDVNSVLDDITSPILAKVKELWPGDGVRLDAIIIAGGGAHMIGNRIKAELKHENVSIVADPVFANAVGYYRFALFTEKK